MFQVEQEEATLSGEESDDTIILPQEGREPVAPPADQAPVPRHRVRRARAVSFSAAEPVESFNCAYGRTAKSLAYYTDRKLCAEL